jgi:hypothetical protein
VFNKFLLFFNLICTNNINCINEEAISSSEKQMEDELKNKYGNILLKEYTNNIIVYICNYNYNKKYIVILLVDKVTYKIITEKKKINNIKMQNLPNINFSHRPTEVTNQYLKKNYTNNIMNENNTNKIINFVKNSWDTSMYAQLFSILNYYINNIFS